MYGYIYLTTNKINGKQYVGQHAKHKFDVKYKGSGKALLKAISKYGFDNFECHIIDTAESQEELNDKEFVYIELYQTLETGYNMCEGGGSVSGYKHTEDTKQKIGESGKRLWEDPEYKQKMSEVHTGEKNPMYGRTGENHPLYNKQLTEEHKQKISENHTNFTGDKNPMAKKCVFRDIVFGCIKDAQTYAKSIGVGRIKFRKELHLY